MVGKHCWRYRGILTALCLAVASLLTTCVATVEPHPPVRLKMAGSTSMRSLVEDLAEAYATRYDYVIIDIDPRGSSLGLDALRDGAVDAALVSRELLAEEQLGLKATVIGYDAIAVLVNDANAVDSLALDRLRGIFSGDILVWSEVGGREVDIQVLSREDGSGTRAAFEGLVLEGESVTLAAMVMPGNETVGRFVAEDPVAIGYASAVDTPLGARPLPVDGVEPGLQALAERDYPLIRPFVVVTRQNPDEEVQAFVNFVLSPAGQVIVGRRYGRAR